jgi:hypothetical protein
VFQLIEKAGERKAVHSKSDLEYMLRRGWHPIKADEPRVQPTDPEPEQPRVKRKYVRKTHAADLKL